MQSCPVILGSRRFHII